MRIGTWNIKNVYMAAALKIVASEVGKYKLDLMGVQEVRWDKGALKGQTILRSSMVQGMKIIS
jgi:exonuclease III